MTDLRQSKNYANYMRSFGWLVERSGQTNIFVKKLWFTAVAKAQRFEKINLVVIKKYHPFLVKLEPLKDIRLPSFKKDGWNLLPTKTLVLDLQKIHLSKDVRYEIRRAEKNNLTIGQSNNIDLFYKILQETMKVGHWQIPIKKEVTSLYKSFQPNNSMLLIAYAKSPAGHPERVKRVEGSLPIAGCLLVWDGSTAHYMYAANTVKGRELGAAYLTLWEAIKFCQKMGLEHLDLEGIYDERFPKNNQKWLGFSHFKKQWGGKTVEYPGSYSKSLLPFLGN